MIVARPDLPPPEPIPDGLQAAVLVTHFDLGIHADYPREKPKRKVALLWELAERRASDGMRFTISREYTASLADSANLRALLEVWRGEPLTPEELKGFDLRVLHGRPCTLEILRKPKRMGLGTYAEVSRVLRARRGDPVLLIETPETYMPDWVAQRMSEALPIDALDDEPAAEFLEEAPF